MKIGVISDTHIPERAQGLPKKILEAFKSVDMVIHAGDLVDMRVIDELRSVCQDVRAVYGNMDPAPVRGKLHEVEIIQAGKFRIAVTHGWGAPHSLVEVLSRKFKGQGVDMVVFGHSHNEYNAEVDGIHFFNPGSATDTVFAVKNSYGIIEINGTIKAKVIRI